MKILLDVRKTLDENAVQYYERAKKLKSKAEKVKRVIIKEKKRKRAWFEEFYHLTTTNGFMALGGRSAQQNEELISKRFEKDDLFFHADIQGGSVVVLKKGIDAQEEDRGEAAMLSACYSRAWKEGFASLDSYSASYDQVKKHSHGEYVPKGGFVIEGARQWYKNLTLEIIIGIKENKLAIGFNKGIFEKHVVLRQGGLEKEEAGEKIAKYLSVEKNEVLHLLPSGSFSVLDK